MPAFEAHLVAKIRAPAASPHHHVSMNATKWVAMLADPALRQLVREAGTVGADGVAVARAVGAPERVPGVELAGRLAEVVAREGLSVGLLGAREAVVHVVARDLSARGARVVVARHGWFPAGEEGDRIAEIAQAAPSLVLVALGSPAAEHFVARALPSWPGVGVVMGVGGTFDVWAGEARLAPRWVGDAGLEWAWRFAGSPRTRFRRAIVGPAAFVWHAARGTRVP